jgi:outer membrane protein assembly factor BamA
MFCAQFGFAQNAPARRPAPAKPQQKKAAAAPAPAPTKWPVKSISIEGGRLYSAEQVIAVSGLKIGQMAGKDEFEAARDRLLATGAFESVGYKFAPAEDKQGYLASFQIVEVEPAYPVKFEELGVPDKDLHAALKARDPLFGQRVPATRPVLDRYTKWVQEILAEHKVTEKIAGRVVATGPDQFVILFRPARALPAVAQVSFTGNQVIQSYQLREAIGGVAIGQPYTEERFRALLDTAVRPLYETRGRVRVNFTTVKAEPTKDVQGLHVLVTVDEGQSYDLGEIAIVGPTPVRPDDLLKAAKLKPGDLANFDQVNQALDRVKAAVRHAGYLQAKVTAERTIDDAKKTVGLGLRVEPGPLYMMGSLTVKGLDLHGEAEIKRMWGMKEGKPFNGDYPDLFLARIKEQNVFEGLGVTKANVKVNESTRVADVTLVFGAAPPPPDEKKRRPEPGSNLPI